MSQQWLNWAHRLQSIAQSGLHYTQNQFDIERYQQVRDIAAEIMANHSDAEADAYRMLFDAQAGHATPKVDVRGVVFQDGKLLMVREALDGDRWTLPGGWADPGESAGEAVVREIREESGYETRATKLLAVYERERHHPPYPFAAFKMFFRCELVGGEASTSHETSEVAFFAEEDIPTDDLSVGRVTAKQIVRFYEHHRNPDLPTEFD